MADSNGEFRINTPGVLAPGTGSGYMPVIIDDVVAPRYPDSGEVGAVISVFRPGELAPIEGLSAIPIPRGAMLCYIEPETAEKMRPLLYAAIRRQQEQLKREQAARGQMGRRG
jgi:hypothetical protein